MTPLNLPLDEARLLQFWYLYTVSVSPSDVLWTTPTMPMPPAAKHMPVSHLKPSSSCEPQSQCTSSAKSWYVQPLTTIPVAAVAATNVWPETWNQNMTARLWSWVQSNSKVCNHLYLITNTYQRKNYIRLSHYNKRHFTISLCQILRKRKKRLIRKTRLNLMLQWAASIIFTNQYISFHSGQCILTFFFLITLSD